MKTNTPSKTYPTPEVRVFSINPEGLLCASTDTFDWGGDIVDPVEDEFSDWKH